MQLRNRKIGKKREDEQPCFQRSQGYDRCEQHEHNAQVISDIFMARLSHMYTPSRPVRPLSCIKAGVSVHHKYNTVLITLFCRL